MYTIRLHGRREKGTANLSLKNRQTRTAGGKGWGKNKIQRPKSSRVTYSTSYVTPADASQYTIVRYHVDEHTRKNVISRC